MKRLLPLSLLAAGFVLATSAQAATLLNVSYDVMRDFYKDYNNAFQKHWQAEGGKPLQIQMSHGGSSKQARAVIDGLPADVITMNMATDINALAEHGGLVPQNWAERLPNGSAPFTSATVFIVRKGNPKSLHDWPDLLKDGVQVVVPNPKTSGNGRYTYLSAWGYGCRTAVTRARPSTSSASCSARPRCSIPAAAPPPPPSSRTRSATCW